MKLRTFYVKSYRSITEATLDNIQNYGVFVGPNNAGKSNLLRAIYISLSIALEGDFQRARRNRQYSYAYRGENYNWERDIPVNLRENKGASTTFKLTFEFSDEEKADFRQKFNINLTKSLQMKFQLFSNRTEYNIIMPGRAKKPMEEKMQDIGLFIRSKLDYEYILCLMLPANLVKTCLPLRRVLVYTPHQFGHEKRAS
jgi:AAA15 family ATPase/GTPase